MDDKQILSILKNAYIEIAMKEMDMASKKVMQVINILNLRVEEVEDE